MFCFFIKSGDLVYFIILVWIEASSQIDTFSGTIEIPLPRNYAVKVSKIRN